MAISPQPEPAAGDYVYNCGNDSDQALNDAETALRLNGCKRFRAEPLADGRVVVHGYLREA